MSVYLHHRGSIFWALTLIAVGTIFLYQNFNPTIHPWQIIGTYWPVLIIFWGLSKLLDYFYAQAHPETAVPPLFTASEVILLILVLMLGTLVSKIALRPWQRWPASLGINLGDEDFADLFLESFTYTQTLSRPVKAQPRLLIVNRRGDIEVRSSDQATLDATVKKTIRAENEPAAKKISDDLKIEFVEQGGAYVLQTNLDSLPIGRAGEGLVVSRSVRLDITLHVPKGTSVEVTVERGDIILDGLAGEQTLTTKRGDTHVTNVDGLLRVHKSGGLTEIREVKGNVELDGRGRDVEVAGVTGTVTVDGEFSGALRFERVSQTLRYRSSRTEMTLQKLIGRLNMEVGSLDASGIDGPFVISTRQKDITLEDFKHSVKIDNTNGDIRLRTSVPPKQPIEIESKKGEIELTLPATSSFQIEAKSRHGEVDCEFSGPNLSVTREGHMPSITGTYGKGGPTIRLATAYGTIRLLRQTGEPGPSTHPAPSRPAPGEKRAMRRLDSIGRHVRVLAPAV